MRVSERVRQKHKIVNNLTDLLFFFCFVLFNIKKKQNLHKTKYEKFFCVYFLEKGKRNISGFKKKRNIMALFFFNFKFCFVFKTIANTHRYLND